MFTEGTQKYFLDSIKLFGDYNEAFEASLVVHTVKRLPAMRETWVQSLGGESLGEGDGNPLQYSCLENSMDRGAL